MKALVADRYGGPEVLRVEEVPTPEPGAGEMLVRVHAASLNALDRRTMRADPWFVRVGRGLVRPKHTGLGADFSGTVERLGPGVGGFEVGEAVFGCVGFELGTIAEYVVVKAADAVAPKPANVSYADAAATPIAAVTALYGLQDMGHLETGQTVLVNGGSGALGSVTVQLAKSLGASSVAAVCSTEKVELVRSLGAERVIDYTTEDFTRGGERYDLVVDTVGNRSVAELDRVVADGGRCVLLGFTTIRRLAGHALAARRVTRRGRVTVVAPSSPDTDRASIDRVAALLESGALRPVIERSYSLEEAPAAIAYLDGGHARAKIVVEVVRD